MISILKPEKDPVLPSSYRPISHLYTTGKVYEYILLTRILSEVSAPGYSAMSNMDSYPNSTSLQLARLVERLTRNFDEKLLTDAVFPDVA